MATAAAPSSEAGPNVIAPDATGRAPTGSSTNTSATATPIASSPVTPITLEQVKAALNKNVPSTLRLTGTTTPSTTWMIHFTDHATAGIASVAPSTMRAYLLLALPHAVSTPLNGGKKFVFPSQPTLTPNWIASEWDTEARAAERDEHNNTIQNYKNMVIIDTALQTFLMELVPVAYYPKAFQRPAGLSTVIWPLNYHAYDLIDDLFQQWNFPTPADERLHQVAFDSQWDLYNSPLMDYLDQIKRADHLAKMMFNPYTEKQLVTKAYTHIKDTVKLSGPLGKADKDWLALPARDQTLEKLCDIFTDAYILCRRRRLPLEPAPEPERMPPDDGAFAMGPPLPHQASDDDSLASVQSILANTFQSWAASMSERIDAKVAAHMSQLGSVQAPTAAPLPTTVVTPQASARGVVPPPAPPVPPLPAPAPAPTTTRRGTPNPVKKNANHLYCCSCGCDVDHSSPDCPRKREGHNDLVVHKEQAKQIRDADKSLKSMPCLKGYQKTMWPSAS